MHDAETLTKDMGLKVTRSGSRITVTANAILKPLDRMSIAGGLVLALMISPSLPLIIERTGLQGWADIFWLTFLATLLLSGLGLCAYLLSPRSLETVFDREGECILRTFNLLHGRYTRRHALPFADARGLTVRATNVDDDNDWMFDLVLMRRDGKFLPLVPNFVRFGQEREVYEDIADMICAFTGLARLDQNQTRHDAQRAPDRERGPGPSSEMFPKCS